MDYLELRCRRAVVTGGNGNSFLSVRCCSTTGTAVLHILLSCFFSISFFFVSYE